jgi:hypothetical protein
MAFNSLYFAALGNQSKRGSAPQKYTYRTTDDVATITGNNYFSDISTLLEVNDEIEVEIVDSVSAPTIRNGNTQLAIVIKVSNLIVAQEISVNKRVLVATLADVSTASTKALTSGIAGVITKITTYLGGAITVGDSALTFDIGGVAITNSAITVATAGSALGVIDTSSPTAARTLAAGDILTATTDGNSTTAQPLYIVYEVTASAVAIDNAVYLTTTMTDISTDGAAGIAGTAWVVSPIAGVITSIRSVLYGAIGTADSVVTGSIGGVAITNGVLTVATAASAAGDVDTVSPTAARTVTAGQAIKFTSDGASSTATPLTITIRVVPN